LIIISEWWLNIQEIVSGEYLAEVDLDFERPLAISSFIASHLSL
jgi:molybdopterin-binding protein